MTLRFEQLAGTIEEMGRNALEQQQRQQHFLQQARQKLDTFGQDWQAINHCLELLGERSPDFRLARPLGEEEALNAGIPLPPIPAQATILACDGSQILPDRHAAFLYYLINVGAIVYHHGSHRPPQESSRSILKFRQEDVLVQGGEPLSGSVVGGRRDLAEIETMAALAQAQRQEPGPRLALLDQRLLYWPPLTPAERAERKRITNGWMEAMSQIHQSGWLLAGYVEGSRRNRVLLLLSFLQHQASSFQEIIDHRQEWPGVADDQLFAGLLPPGARSALFLDISEDNGRYAEHDPGNEVCFFYLNVAAHGSHVARIDLPRWVAEEPAAVDAVHALVVDQARILGNYPYVLARADEAAVVGKGDQAELENWIALAMQKHEVEAAATAKQSSKELARAGKSRFTL